MNCPPGRQCHIKPPPPPLRSVFPKEDSKWTIYSQKGPHRWQRSGLMAPRPCRSPAETCIYIAPTALHGVTAHIYTRASTFISKQNKKTVASDVRKEARGPMSFRVRSSPNGYMILKYSSSWNMILSSPVAWLCPHTNIIRWLSKQPPFITAVVINRVTCAIASICTQSSDLDHIPMRVLFDLSGVY